MCEEFFLDEEGDEGFATHDVQKSFKDLCAPSSIGQNWDSCQKHCKDYACCFSDSETSCLQDNLWECDEYASCKVFYDDASSDTSANVATAEIMTSRCAASNPDRDLDDCEEWCFDYECCFYFSNSCYSSKKQTCDDNDFCRSVFDELRDQSSGNSAPAPLPSVTGGGISQPSIPSSIGNSPSLPASNNNAGILDQGLDDTELLILARACNIDQLRKSDSECRMLCQGAECCFSRTSHCDGMQKFCNDHAICSGMFT